MTYSRPRPNIHTTEISGAEAASQLALMLSAITDDRLARLTVDELAPRYRVRREKIREML